MYILVFTCLNIRAVHLELLPSMSCADFLQAFIRFCNSNSIPSAVYSDNASTFLQSMGILADSRTDDAFSEYLIKNNIKHIKIPLYAAWVGAYWERMIRTIKSCLSKTVGRKHFNYFDYLTLLSDVQNCINSRPLTYVDSESLDVITPNSFLKFETGRSLILDVSEIEYEASGRRELVETLLKRDERLEKFKEMWNEGYLLSLRESSRDVYQDAWENKVSVGD